MQPTPSPSDFWDQRYTEAGWAYGTAPNDFLRAEAGRIPPGAVLCLAEGEGRNAVFLAGRGHRIEAVDQSSAGLAKTRLLVAREVRREIQEGNYHQGTGAVLQIVGRKPARSGEA